MRIAGKGHGGVFVSEQVRQRARIHPAFESTGGKGMTQGVYAPVGQADAPEEQFKAALIRAHTERPPLLTDDIGGGRRLFARPQIRQ